MTTSTFTKRVAAVVRTAAEGKGWSQAELARQAGIPRVSVYRYFYKEERDISLDVMAQVAEALGMSVSEILRRAEGASEAPDGPRPAKRPVVRRVTARAASPLRRID